MNKTLHWRIKEALPRQGDIYSRSREGRKAPATQRAGLRPLAEGAARAEVLRRGKILGVVGTARKLHGDCEESRESLTERLERRQAQMTGSGAHRGRPAVCQLWLPHEEQIKGTGRDYTACGEGSGN